MPDFRTIPSIDELRKRSAIRALEARFGASATVEALRAAAAEIRRVLREGHDALEEHAVAERIEASAAGQLQRDFSGRLDDVINATGVIIHTNLGRAPLADRAIERIRRIAAGYASLEYDVERGVRGRRDVHAEPLLSRLTGAESAVVVNNNAAAVMLILAALANGREVIVSRGELVEIGGGFRVPDVMRQSGAILREVGTTNKTRGSDYAAAVSDRTALILRIHPSNFRIEGFTERPPIEELVAIGRKLGVPVAEDIGGGHLVADPAHPLSRVEPSVRASIESGVDICCFSGDKLLGGPQAGIIVGRRDLVASVRTHPLMRALRVDKMTYAALEATLVEYLAGRASSTVPVQRMLAMSAEEVRARAETLATAVAALDGWSTELVSGTSATGGGTAPAFGLPTCLVALSHRNMPAEGIEASLRHGKPCVVARIEDGRLLIDLRTVPPERDEDLISVIGKLVTG